MRPGISTANVETNICTCNYMHQSGSQIMSACLAELCDPKPDPGSRDASSINREKAGLGLCFLWKKQLYNHVQVVRSWIWLGIADSGSQPSPTVRSWSAHEFPIWKLLLLNLHRSCRISRAEWEAQDWIQTLTRELFLLPTASYRSCHLGLEACRPSLTCASMSRTTSTNST